MGFNVIAAVRTVQELEAAANSGAGAIFLLAPNLMTLADCIKKAHNSKKKIFIHIDLAEGIGKDQYGLRFVKKLGVDGIISTRTSMIRLAADEGLHTVQRFFIVDSHSIDTTIESVKASKADMIEIMPGTLPKIIERLNGILSMPIVAGGLIETAAEVTAAKKSGAAAVSTGKCHLWG